MEEILVLKNVAELLRISPSTVYRLAKNKQIPHFRVGGELRFRRQSLEQWMRAMETGKAS